MSYIAAKLRIRYLDGHSGRYPYTICTELQFATDLPSYGIWSCGSCHQSGQPRSYEVGGVRHTKTCDDNEARIWEFGSQAIKNGGPGLGPTSVTMDDMSRALARPGDLIRPASAELNETQIEGSQRAKLSDEQIYQAMIDGRELIHLGMEQAARLIADGIVRRPDASDFKETS